MKEKLKVLVVEDAPGDVFLIKFYLEEIDPEGYEIEDVDNLKDAHDKIERNAFDIILLDLHLPDSEGIVTLKNTIAKFPSEAFIVLTGLSDEKIGLEAVKNGAQDFLVKGKITSNSLDSSIKFSHERSKLKRKVKVFNEAMMLTEQELHFRTFFVDVNLDMLISFSDLSKYISYGEVVQTMNHFFELFDEKFDLEKEKNKYTSDKIHSMNISRKGKDFTLKIKRSEIIKDVLICILNKA